MKYKSLLVSFLFLALNLFSYAGFEDSLQRLIKQQSGLPKAKNNQILGEYYFKQNKYDQSLTCALKSLQTALDLNHERLELDALILSASDHYALADYPKSKTNCNQALVLARKLKDPESEAKIHAKLGSIDNINQEYETAAKHYLKAIAYFEKQADWNSLVPCYHNMATLFSAVGQQEKVVAYHSKIKKCLAKKLDLETEIKAYAYLSNHYSDYLDADKSYLDSSDFYASKGIRLSLEKNNYSRLSSFFIAKGKVHELRKEFSKSIEVYNEALKYKEFNNVTVDYFAFLGLFYSYYELNELSKAKTYLDLIENHDLTVNDKSFELQYFQMAYDYYKKAKDFELALGFHEKLSALQEELYSAENIEVVTKLEKKYNQNKNYTSILELRNKNKIKNLVLVSVVLFLLLVISISIYIYRQSIRKKELKILDIEQSLGRARMNPHFIFNVLSSLQTLALDPAKREVMPHYMAQFSKIMRESLESSFSELISLEDELDFLINYLELQKLVKGKKFDFEIHVPDAMNTFDIQVPVMIFQPFIENSIEHGFAEMQFGGKVDIYFREEQDFLSVRIQDNGQWNSVASNKAYPSRAAQIIHDRFFLLQKRYKKSATFELKKTAQGVEVEIHLPHFN